MYQYSAVSFSDVDLSALKIYTNNKRCCVRHYRVKLPAGAVLLFVSDCAAVRSDCCQRVVIYCWVFNNTSIVMHLSEYKIIVDYIIIVFPGT